MLITDITLKPSKLLLGLWVAIVLTSLVIILTLPLAWVAKTCLLTGTGFYACRIFWRDCLLKSKNSISQLFTGAKGWHIVTANAITAVEVCGDSLLTFPLSVLRLRVAGRRRKISCVICYDSLDAQSYRQLLVLLRTTHAREAEGARRLHSIIPH
jgi:hypothetical protein